VPSKEENARNGLPETDWRDAQYDMLYLPVTETVRYHYDFNSNRPARQQTNGKAERIIYTLMECNIASFRLGIRNTGKRNCTAL